MVQHIFFIEREKKKKNFWLKFFLLLFGVIYISYMSGHFI